jgi:hypothetical protein
MRLYENNVALKSLLQNGCTPYEINGWSVLEVWKKIVPQVEFGVIALSAKNNKY